MPPVGFWATSKREAILAAAVAITGLIAVSFAGSMLLPFPSHLLATVLGIAFGWLLRTPQRRRERSHAPLDPRIAVHEH